MKKEVSMISEAFKLPRISCNEREQEKMEDILNEMHHAKAVVTFFQNQHGHDKFLFTDLGEKEFLILMMVIHRHIEVFEFFKLLIVTIEKMREDYTRATEFTSKAIAYIKLKQKKQHELYDISKYREPEIVKTTSETA